MRRCCVLLLLAAMVAMSSTAFADAQTIDIRAIMQYCHSQFVALAGVTFYDPAAADWTVDGGLGILDSSEMELLQLILATPTLSVHDAVHAAFTTNQAKCRSAIGTTIIGLTSDPNNKQMKPGTTQQYALDALMGAYVTMGEWTLWMTTIEGLKDSAFGARVTVPTSQTGYDLTQKDLLKMCGDVDNDGAQNCYEFWAATPNSYVNAVNGSVATAKAVWSSWVCLEGGLSYRFVYNPDTDRVYMTSPTEVTWAEAQAFTVQYPGGASLPVTMATIRNATENEYVKTLGAGNTVWIGCSDAGKDAGHTAPNPDDWYWFSAPTASMEYRNWRSGEPNGVNGSEDCGSMRDDGTWNDVGPNSGTPPTPRKYYAIYESVNTYADVNPANGAPDMFEDVNNDLIPDGFGVPRPVADFTASATTGDMPLPVTFTDISLPNGADITQWSWNFGDGSPVFTTSNPAEKSPSHTYLAQDEPSSTYTVTLTVTNSNGEGSKQMAITVNYVCEFEGQLTEQGEALNTNAATVNGALATALAGENMDAWSEWDIEGFPTEIVGDGLPDAATIRLLEYVVCTTRLPMNASVYTDFTDNLATFEAEFAGNTAKLAYAELFAGLLGLNAGMQASAASIIGVADASDYAIFGDAKVGPLFAADGDLDGDGKTNAAEYAAVLAAGGDLDVFLMAATDPYNLWPGNPDLPVAGIIGLGLLAGGMLMSAAVALRKK